MKMADLSTLLRSMNVPDNAYSLGVDRTETYCLVFDNHRWHVYYSERGNRNDEAVFTNEPDACQAFLDLLMSDHGLREELGLHKR